MGQFNIRNGWTLGPHANFFARTDNLFSEGDTTPDVTNGCLFFSQNTTTTAITHFDLTPMASNTGGTWHQQFEGKRIIVMMIDGSTSLVNAGQLVLSGTSNLQGANNSVELLYHNSAWIELSRSINQVTDTIRVTSMSIADYVADTTSQTINATNNTRTIFGLSYATSPLLIRRVLNGQQGQHLTLVSAGPSDLRVIVNTDATGTFVSTSSTSSTQFRLASSGAISFIYQGAKWLESTPVWANTSVTYTT